MNFSRNKSSEVPNFDVIPKELISFFLENANESTPFNRIQSTSTANNSSRYPTRSNTLVKFPAPLTYNYTTKIWQSIYRTQSFDSSKDVIPWYREKDARPVYPVLDDRITFFLSPATKRVSYIPYSSNECPIIQSLADIKKQPMSKTSLLVSRTNVNFLRRKSYIR